MYIFSFFFFFFFTFGALYFGRLSCIYIWDVQTLVIIYMTSMVYGLYLWFVFMAMCMDMCLWLWIVFMVCVYGHRVLILRKARFNKHRGLLLHEAHFSNSWVLLLYEAYFRKMLGLTPSRGPFW